MVLSPSYSNDDNDDEDFVIGVLSDARKVVIEVPKIFLFG